MLRVHICINENNKTTFEKKNHISLQLEQLVAFPHLQKQPLSQFTFDIKDVNLEEEKAIVILKSFIIFRILKNITCSYFFLQKRKQLFFIETLSFINTFTSWFASNFFQHLLKKETLLLLFINIIKRRKG